METKIHKVVQVTHVELQPIQRSIQVYLKSMAHYIKLLCRLYLGVVAIYLQHEQGGENFYEHFSNCLVVNLLLPLVPNLCVFRAVFLLLKISWGELCDFEAWLDHICKPVGNYPD